MESFDTDVLIIGSGFGGSVAALRFAELGQKVIVLERGDWITRERFDVGPELFWKPEIGAFGHNVIALPGQRIFSWLGSGVGGGSNLFAAALLRRESFADFPKEIASTDMGPYYALAERMMGATPYPDYPPYSDVVATQLLYRAGKKLHETHPDLIERHGALNLAMSFAPPGRKPGEAFTNAHGASQRYSDPAEQAILGGDIGSKNTLDRNYLFLAQQRGAEIRPLHDATRIEPLPGGAGYRVKCKRYRREQGLWQRLRRHWFPKSCAPNWDEVTVTARRLVVSAGALGSTELLLRNRDVEKTLPALSPQLGHRYSTNGDYITLLYTPFKGLALCWGGFIAALVLLAMGQPLAALVGLAAYYAGLWTARSAHDPDVGSTTSDHIRFRAPNGEAQGLYIEGGRYPAPEKLLVAWLVGLLGRFHPTGYPKLSRLFRWLRFWVPPFGALAHVWPIPLLTMGRDKAYGTISLEPNGRPTIDFDIERNRDFYRYADQMGQLVASALGLRWWPSLPLKWTGRLQVPHNQGGVPMGDNPETGVVDHAGRVFGMKNFMVLDGSIIPVSPGPNPALTILAISERAMEVIKAQLSQEDEISAGQAVQNRVA